MKMIKNMIDVIFENGIGDFKPIKDIKNSCCQICDLIVYDFDNLKDNVSSGKKGMSTAKSCDCMYFLPDNKYILIEMKSLKNIIHFQKKENDHTKADEITDCIPKKFKDSIHVLNLSTSLEFLKFDEETTKTISQKINDSLCDYILLVNDKYYEKGSFLFVLDSLKKKAKCKRKKEKALERTSKCAREEDDCICSECSHYDKLYNFIESKISSDEDVYFGLIEKPRLLRESEFIKRFCS